jgi:hypothetical protein
MQLFTVGLRYVIILAKSQSCVPNEYTVIVKATAVTVIFFNGSSSPFRAQVSYSVP